ncbi:hypothetical protein FACS1894102_5620 [Spirochaetia bacterium]|nr:hypothetical protein FACS1894102_5620 [Spirochaetia bacterium]
MNNKMTSKAVIYYHDIGDYLNHEEKLAIVKKAGSISNVDWQTLHRIFSYSLF